MPNESPVCCRATLFPRTTGRGTEGEKGGSDRAPRDGVPTAPSAAVAGAGGGELEFNMAAIDLTDMKVHRRA